MALILKSDTTMDTIPEGTPTLPPLMQILASDSFSGTIGQLPGRALPNDLGGSASLVWAGTHYAIIEGGGAEPTDSINRVGVAVGGGDVMGAVAITDFQSGLLITLNARAESTLATARRIRLAIEKTSVTLIESGVETAPVSAQAPHVLQVGDVVALAVRGQSPVEASVWINGDILIPWTAMGHSHSGDYFSIIAGGTQPGFVINDFMLHEII